MPRIYCGRTIRGGRLAGRPVRLPEQHRRPQAWSFPELFTRCFSRGCYVPPREARPVCEKVSGNSLTRPSGSAGPLLRLGMFPLPRAARQVSDVPPREARQVRTPLHPRFCVIALSGVCSWASALASRALSSGSRTRFLSALLIAPNVVRGAIVHVGCTSCGG